MIIDAVHNCRKQQKKSMYIYTDFIVIVIMECELHKLKIV